ncbi:MAG: hypothetical protein ABL903_06465 [Methylococcales bacterium]
MQIHYPRAAGTVYRNFGNRQLLGGRRNTGTTRYKKSHHCGYADFAQQPIGFEVVNFFHYFFSSVLNVKYHRYHKLMAGQPLLLKPTISFESHRELLDAFMQCNTVR